MKDRSHGGTDPQPDGMDRWLRETLASESGAAPSECLDPDTLAAWAEGALSAAERSFAEAHAARCARCQSMLAVMARSIPGEPESAPSPMRKWLMMLMPAAAAVAAVVVWFAVDPNRSNIAQQPLAKVAQADREARSTATPPPSPPPAVAAPPASTAANEVAAAPVARSAEADKDGFRDKRSASSVPAKTTPSLDEMKKLEARQEREATQRADASSERMRSGLPQAAPPAAANEAVTVVSESPRVQTSQQQVAQVAPPSPQQQQQQSTQAGASAASARGPSGIVPPPPAAPAPPAAKPVDAVGERVTAEAAGKGGRGEGFGGGAGRSGGAQAAPAENLRALAMREVVAPPVVSPDGKMQWRVVHPIVQQSANAGAEWSTAYTLDAQTRILAGSALSSSVCWFVGRSGAIIATFDGRTWQRIPFPVAIDLVAVTANDAQSATVVTSDKRVFVTTDRGQQWTQRTP